MDNGSSTNVLFSNTYRKMGHKESDITRRYISLIRLSSESKNMIRETVLQVYMEGVNIYTKLLILDSPYV